MPSIEEIIINTIAGGAGGAVALWVQQRFVWRPQKRTELRNKVFDDAMTALAMYESDALDAKLQSDKATEYSGTGYVPHTALRKETWVALQKSQLQVKAFFSQDAFAAYSLASRADIRIGNHDGFADKSDRAINLMAKELGLL